ncbi:uncharacterized protein N7511_009350 [Penicillium nucicola]|uniref:uncharacterized protein n=1 Tax=Penicillium nucicola TaxID=1850975 RepID=UPI00254557CB|nr:uncharacterized protein N7511_009350 [Penicillium nucicola]KAJ5747654.1 hypothetical protein N7511_009350 [Penicillium nucicola]
MSLRSFSFRTAYEKGQSGNADSILISTKQNILFQVLQGLGVGQTLLMAYVTTQTVLKPEDIPVDTSLLQRFIFFDASVKLAIAEAIFENVLVARFDSLRFQSNEIENMLSAGFAEARRVVSAEYISGVLDAYNYAITRSFYVVTNGILVGVPEQDKEQVKLTETEYHFHLTS